MSSPRCEILCKVALLLLFSCLTLALLVGDIGFQGDDWWVFSFPFWNSFPDSVYEYAKESKRPVEGLYWISMFQIFRFSRVPYNFFSLILLAGSSLALGACLLRAFPNRRDTAVLSVFFGFLLPPVSNLTFMIHTDNSRISNLLFWTSVFSFQRWASKSRSWGGLFLPCVFYLLAVFTYENTTLLIFAVPAFVWPILSRLGERDRPGTAPIVRLGVAIGVVFAVFVAMRFLVFSGGAVGHGSLLPSYDLVTSYASVLAKYLWAPFSNIPSDGWAVGWGFSVAVAVAVLLLLSSRVEGAALLVPPLKKEASTAIHKCPHPNPLPEGEWASGFDALKNIKLITNRCTKGISRLEKSPLTPLCKRGELSGFRRLGSEWALMLRQWIEGAFASSFLSLHQGLYVAFLGVAVLVLGTVPYLLAGYGASFGFTSQSRIYSSAAFGVAIILGATLGASWRSRTLRLVTRWVAIVLMAFMAVFFADLGTGWKEAATKRDDLCASLVKQVPDVKPGTTFLFLDLQWYVSNRAVVFQGVDGLPEFVRILYGRNDLYAYFLYPLSEGMIDSDARTASVSPQGLIARGSAIRGPIPLDSLLIFRRRGSKLVLLDSIAEAQNEVAMHWNRVSVIKSNRDLISRAGEPFRSWPLNDSRRRSLVPIRSGE